MPQPSNQPPPSPHELILQALSVGLDERTAAQQAGISYAIYLQWLEVGEAGQDQFLTTFAKAVTSLKAMAAMADLTKISGSAKEDWRAAAWRHEYITGPLPNPEADRVDSEQVIRELPKLKGKERTRVKSLEDLIEHGSFASVYFDLRNADPPLNAYEACFVAWYQVYISNPSVLRLTLGMPRNMSEMAHLLGVSRTTLYTWKVKYGNKFGLPIWLDDKLANMMPIVLLRLEQNVLSRQGAVSNTAIKIAIDLYQSRQSVAVGGKTDEPKPGDDDPTNSIDQSSGEELDAIADNLILAEIAEASRSEEITFEEITRSDSGQKET